LNALENGIYSVANSTKRALKRLYRFCTKVQVSRVKRSLIIVYSLYFSTRGSQFCAHTLTHGLKLAHQLLAMYSDHGVSIQAYHATCFMDSERQP
jgi:hypothetical protein